MGRRVEHDGVPPQSRSVPSYESKDVRFGNVVLGFPPGLLKCDGQDLSPEGSDRGVSKQFVDPSHCSGLVVPWGFQDSSCEFPPHPQDFSQESEFPSSYPVQECWFEFP